VQYLAELRELSGNDSSIEFIGNLDEISLRDEYRSADIYILPSEWHEPFAISPLEAMACGATVVATATGGTGEVLRDGINSLIFPAGDETMLAEKLAALAAKRSLRHQLAAAARSIIEQKYTLRAMVDAIESQLVIEAQRQSATN
jgi:glycosyltransferase involved in cell wall biosynthesis